MNQEIIRIPNPMMSKESMDLIGWLISDVNNRFIPGAIVEAGCNNGLTSIFISSVISDTSRRLHCYDFFSDIPESCAQLDEESGLTSIPPPDVSIFTRLFSEHPELTLPVIHKGPFETTMPSELPKTIALALIDSDFYSSTRYALSSIMPRIPKGGIITVHDWEQPKWGKGVQKAVTEVWKGPINYKGGLAIILP